MTLGGSLDGLVVCYLVQFSDGVNVLIDSGIAADHQPPVGAPSPTHETDIIKQLAALCLRPDEIDFLICTHFDADHAGYHSAFTHAELVLRRSHYEVARGGHPRFASTRSHWDPPALRYRLLDVDTELLPGLTLIKTSGHAPGHQSALVRPPRMGATAFNLPFSIPALTVLAVVAGSVLICMAVGASVAWRATHVRPREALRYD
jgi:N-acyl homoserine lactone hydrolase